MTTYLNNIEQFKNLNTSNNVRLYKKKLYVKLIDKLFFTD